MKTYVIIGSGPAGATAAETLRKLDAESKIIVVTDEDYVFYRREHIIGLLSGDETEKGLFEKGMDFYEKLRVDFVSGKVTHVDAAKSSLMLANGSTLRYDFLLVASGGKPIIPLLAGVQLEGISTLYTLDDAKRVSKLVKEAKKVIVVGAGTIAMKVVPILRKIGLEVALVEKADRLWPTVFDKAASNVVERRLMDDNVEIMLNQEVSEFKGENGKVRMVNLKSQRALSCDLVLITIGLRSSIDFLNDNGIEIDQGVLVNQYLQTNVDNVYAAGDVAQAPDSLYQAPRLHPNWSSAEEQGELAAYNMAGIQKEYEGAVPLSSMTVSDLGIIAAGITQPSENFEELSRLSTNERIYRKFILKENKLIGALIIEKGLNRKSLKPLIKKAVSEMAYVGDAKTNLLQKDFDFHSILKDHEMISHV